MKNKPRFVFDTNSLVSVVLLSESVSKRALQKAERLGSVVLSKETHFELTDVLLRPKFDKYLPIEDRIEFIERVEARYEFIHIVSNFKDSRDEKDNKFLNIAYDASASCLVSGDKDLLVLNPFHNIPILTPRNFVDNF